MPGRPTPIAAWLLLVATATSAAEPGPAALAPERKEQLERALADVTALLEPLRSDAHHADAQVFAKGVAWALRDQTTYTSADLALLEKALSRCHERARAIKAGARPWTEKRGRVVRGFVSAVDGSVQPYGLIVPASYDRSQPMRLDVVLHGSTRPEGTSELRFMNRFDEGDGPGKGIANRDYLELHPLGRVENGYRWAGETDVFEAIEAVCHDYAVDRDRIVLRGMSMGASGTWHLGLKHPDHFVALGPYCGYVDTHRFSETPMPNFVKVGTLAPHQEATLHMLDSVDYAANAGMVPAIACMGEKDVFFQAHEIMSRAMEKEGLTLVNLISPGTGHVLDPTTHREQMKRIGEIAARGLNRSPQRVRFVTWTLKYSRCHWLQILELGAHYERAEVDARVATDGRVEVAEPRNIQSFAILPPVAATATRVRVGDTEIALPAQAGRRGIVLKKDEGRWVYAVEPQEQNASRGKRPGVQGPIDDAFTSPFLCVRGTGMPWNPAVQAWADARLSQFADDWRRYFRGELPVKDDTAVTPEDVRRCNLILFGDPGSNRWIRDVLPQLPIEWSRIELTMGTERYKSASHGPILIQPNPLAASRYVVLNSGHTFGAKELGTLNYLLFPRLGDWAVVKVEPSRSRSTVEVVRAGLCDERWKIPDHAE